MKDQYVRQLDRDIRVVDFSDANATEVTGTDAAVHLGKLKPLVVQLTKAKASQGGGSADAHAVLIEGLLLDIRLIHRTAHVIAQDVLGFEDFFPAVPAANPEAVLTTTDTILGNLIVDPADDPATQAAKADRIAKFVAHGMDADFATQLQTHRAQVDTVKTTEDNADSTGHENTGAIPGLVSAAIIECNYLDAIYQNKFRNRPDKLAAWLIANHVERAPVSAATKAKQAAKKAAKKSAGTPTKPTA